jgi:hypothetical protein
VTDDILTALGIRDPLDENDLILEPIDQSRRRFSTAYLDSQNGQPLIADFAWSQRDVPVECSPASGSFSLTILIATPVTLPMISAWDG